MVRGIAALALLLVAACSEPSNETPTTFDRLASDEVAYGERVATILGCNGCHGRDLQGRDWSDEMGVLWTANLTRSAAQHSDAELVSMITTGRKQGRDLHGMPSRIFAQLTPTDLAAIVAYIRTVPVGGAIHPEPTFGPELRRMMAAGTYKSAAQEVAATRPEVPPDLGDEHALGRYIVRSTCAECHGSDLRGGPPPFPGDPALPDLTAMVPAYDARDFATLLHTGKAAGGREVGLMSEVARGRFSHLTENEVAAIRRYILAYAKQQR